MRILGNCLTSAFLQLGAVIIFSLLVWLIHWARFCRSGEHQSFPVFIGLRPLRFRMDARYTVIFAAFIIFGAISTSVEFRLSDGLRNLLASENSPYGKILKNGFNFSAVLCGVIYCFIQAAAAEEIFFRGLVARRLWSWLGFRVGNAIQALIFWLMHFIIFGLLTGEWVSSIQLITFLTSFGAGLLLGYVDFRKPGQPVGPSWLLHGSMNFAAFLALAAELYR